MYRNIVYICYDKKSLYCFHNSLKDYLSVDLYARYNKVTHNNVFYLDKSSQYETKMSIACIGKQQYNCKLRNYLLLPQGS